MSLPWDIGSASVLAERAGQGEVSKCTGRVQAVYMGLTVNSPWLELGGPFLGFKHK